MRLTLSVLAAVNAIFFLMYLYFFYVNHDSVNIIGMFLSFIAMVCCTIAAILD